jgi:hypothetical protein
MNETTEIDIFTELEKLRIWHYEDSLYEMSNSCPKLMDNFSDCLCGADAHNKILDGIISFMKRSKLRGRTIDDLPESIREQLFKCNGNVADVCVGGVYVRYRHNGVEWIRGE